MSSVDVSSESAAASPPAKAGEMKLEVVLVPVSDVDRAKAFYEGLGWRMDVDLAARTASAWSSSRRRDRSARSSSAKGITAAARARSRDCS